MNVVKTKLHDCVIIEPKVFGDERGFFLETFQAERYAALAGIILPFVQDNYSRSSKSVLRGLHYQKIPHCEIKLVSCLVGEIWDVVVDLRYNSPSFLQWHAERLSGKNQAALYIPKGCAHGFQTLTDNCQLFYLHSDSYHSDGEAGINPTDTKLCISWPLGISEISERDKNHPLLDNNFTGINIR